MPQPAEEVEASFRIDEKPPAGFTYDRFAVYFRVDVHSSWQRIGEVPTLEDAEGVIDAYHHAPPRFYL